MMNKARLFLLPDGASLINTARGALVDESALLSTIKSKKLGAASINCFAVEPGGNSSFNAHKNIVMLPHIRSAARDTRDAMGFRALDNLDPYFAGIAPQDHLI